MTSAWDMIWADKRLKHWYHCRTNIGCAAVIPVLDTIGSFVPWWSKLAVVPSLKHKESHSL